MAQRYGLALNKRNVISDLISIKQVLVTRMVVSLAMTTNREGEEGCWPPAHSATNRDFAPRFLGRC
jgi:hypothetical protein